MSEATLREIEINEEKDLLLLFYYYFIILNKTTLKYWDIFMEIGDIIDIQTNNYVMRREKAYNRLCTLFNHIVKIDFFSSNSKLS